MMESAKRAMGMALGAKVRYAIVGLGDISQRCLMPAVKHTGNSEMVALVTSDPKKAELLCKEYGVKDCYSYEQFEQMLQSQAVDAIYLATPNWRHLEFAVPALKAGIHVLLEKPMEISEAKCKEIMEAQRSSGAKLLVAYRLHFEPATVEAIERVRCGELGQVHMFSCLFAQMVKPDNHRAQNGVLAGPIYDIGTYPVNAVRNLFAAEPIEVSAVGIRHPGTGFPSEFDDTVAVTLTFPEHRIAQFTVSYYGNPIDEYTIAGTKGSIRVSPGFMYDTSLEFSPIKIGTKTKHESFKNTDQFGGELKYFSDCILKNIDPEADGEEGWLDVRVLEAIVRALETKTPQRLEPYARRKGIMRDQAETLRHISEPKEFHAAPPVK